MAAALRRGIGFTDLAKRDHREREPAPRGEYGRRRARVERLVRAFRPRTVVFVGLDGFRRAVDRARAAGSVRGGFAGRARVPGAVDLGPKRRSVTPRAGPPLQRARALAR